MVEFIEVQTIQVTTGATELTWPAVYTEVTGEDITGAGISVAWGSWEEPGAWSAPEVQGSGSVTQAAYLAVNPGAWIPAPATALLYWVSAQSLATSALAPGDYYYWMRIPEATQTVVRRMQHVIIT